MKITNEDYEHLAYAIRQTITSNPGMREAYQSQGLPDMRYRWDLLAMSGINTSPLYQYLDDSHIDTALRQITGTN